MTRHGRGRYWDEFTAGEVLVFGERVAHGILTLAVSNGQQNLSGWFEGTTFALLGLDRVRFTAPVKFGDTVHTELTSGRRSRRPSPTAAWWSSAWP
jgi:acyl dehydratase